MEDDSNIDTLPTSLSAASINGSVPSNSELSDDLAPTTPAASSAISTVDSSTFSVSLDDSDNQYANTQEVIDEIVTNLADSASSRNMVDDFLRRFGDRAVQMNVIITNVVLNVCLRPSPSPFYLPSCDLRRVRKLIEKQIENETTQDQGRGGVDHQTFDNLVKFLELLNSSAWRSLSTEHQFDSYFVKLMLLLFDADERNLYRLSIVARLSLVDNIVKNRETVTATELTLTKEFAVQLMTQAYPSSERRVWKSCLVRLGQWIKAGPPFSDAQLLRYVIYSLKDTAETVIRQALAISSDLMNDSRLRPDLKTFVNQLAVTLAYLRTSPFEPFKMVLSCWETVHVYTESMGNPFRLDFDKYLWSGVFDKNRNRAKQVADLFQRLRFRGEPALFDLYEVIKFLLDKPPAYLPLFVDAFVDSCPLLRNWPVFASALMRWHVEFPRADLLLTLVVATVERIVSDASPRLQNTLRAELSAAFGGVITDLCAQRLRSVDYFQLMTYFDWNAIPVDRLVKAMDICVDELLTTTTTSDVDRMKVVFQLLVSVSKERDQPYLVQVGEERVERVKTFFQRQCDLIFGRRWVEERPRLSAAAALRGLGIVAAQVPLDDDWYGLELPFDLVLRNADSAAASCKESAVALALGHAKSVIERHPLKADLMDDAVALAYVCERYNNVYKALTLFIEHLRTQFASRLGRTLFLAACECLEKLFEVDESLVSKMLNQRMTDCMGLYVHDRLRETLCDPAVDVSETKDIVIAYLHLIEIEILPLCYVYDVVIAYSSGCLFVESHLRSLISKLCRENDADEMGKFLVKMLIQLQCEAGDSASKFAQVVAIAAGVNHLLYPLRKEIVEVIYCMHRESIEYCYKGSNVQERIKFLYALAELSYCMDNATKAAIRHQLQRKELVDPFIIEHYWKSLSKVYRGWKVKAAAVKSFHLSPPRMLKKTSRKTEFKDPDAI